VEGRRAEVSALDGNLTLRSNRFRIRNGPRGGPRDTSPPVARAPALLPADVVDQDVLPQPIRRHEKGAAFVDPRHLVDELGQVRPSLEHERVDDDAIARAALDLTQRLLDRLV